MQLNSLTGMQSAAQMLDVVAASTARFAAGASGGGDPSLPAAVQPGAGAELASDVAAMISAQLMYTVNARVLHMSLDTERALFDAYV